jgi:hypothetical protein
MFCYQYVDPVISDRVNGRSQTDVCQKADLNFRERIRKANYIRERIGSGLEADWKRIGSGLEADWERIGSGLEADWKWIGSGLRANSVGGIGMQHTTFLHNGYIFYGCLVKKHVEKHSLAISILKPLLALESIRYFNIDTTSSFRQCPNLIAISRSVRVMVTTLS